MNTETNDHAIASTILAPIVRKLRFFVRARMDKLQLLLMMIVGGAVPLFLCWGLPSLMNAARTNQAEQAAAAALMAQEAFQANHPELLALCDSTDFDDASGELPSDPTLVIVRNGGVDEYQATLPDQFRADPPDSANVLLCLGREHAAPVETCLDGSVPDLSMFLGWELLIGVEPSFNFARAHPEVGGRNILRYLTDYAMFNIESGQLIASGQISGSDAAFCVDPPEESPLETMTGEALRVEVLYLLYGEPQTLEGFNDWVTAALSPE